MTYYSNSPNGLALAPAQSYTQIRSVMAPELRNLSDSEIEAILRRANVSAEDMEDYMEFLGGLGRAFSSAGRAVSSALGSVGRTVVQNAPQILSGAASGAMTGSALGPWGALGGAVLGGLGGALSGGGQQPSAPMPAAPPAPLPAAPRPSAIHPMRRPPAPGIQSMPTAIQGGSGAAGQLLSLLGRPEVLQALMSMALGQAGSRTVDVGSQSVPVGAFTNMLNVLTRQAGEQYHSLTAGMPGVDGEAYLRDYAGDLRVDPANADKRAAVLAEMLQETAPLHEAAASEFIEQYFESRYDEETPEDTEYYSEDVSYEYAESGW